MESDIVMKSDENVRTGLEWKAEYFQNANVPRLLDVLKAKIVRHLQLGALSSYQTVRDPILSLVLCENEFQNLVLSPLEWFLYGEEPCEARRKLLELNNPPTLCAKIFKNGEPTYSCRDCALDATCVLCMTCFGKSIHKDHNYRLSTSSGGGGGCCDCGDVEAWKQGAACELHMAGLDSPAQEDPSKKLSPENLNRVEYLFSIVLDYCVKYLCHPNTEDLCPDLMNRILESGRYATVLFNDESHTFDTVISALVKSVPECTTNIATDFATIVDREGRATIYVGTKELCERVKSSVEDRTGSYRNAVPLRCETMHIHLFACQLVALHLTKWLNGLVNDSDCLRRIHCKLCTSHSEVSASHVVQALHADGKLWKVARTHTQQLFMNTLLKDIEGKVTFGIEFAKNYPILVNDFYNDDQEHSISATSISVQIFTVPSLSQMLIAQYGLMEIIIEVLKEKTKIYLTGTDGVFDFQKDNGKTIRLYWVIHDLRYILQNRPSTWDDVLKRRFLRFLELFFSFYRHFQEMASVKRVTGAHVELEPDWIKDFDLEQQLSDLIPLIIKWCESDRDILLKTVSLALNCLKEIRKRRGTTQLKKYSDGGKSWKVIDCDVASNKVSLHIPVVRLLAGLIGACVNHSINIRDVLGIKEDDDTLTYLAYPLKALVFVAQVKAGMWKKNGLYVRKQVHAYQKEFSGEMFDRDIFLMQVLATCMDKHHFVVVLLDMFKLSSWASCSFDVGKLDEGSVSQQLSLAGEFLRLLIIILGERYKCNVGQVDASCGLRREVIHRLSLGTMSRSELLKCLPVSDAEFEQSGLNDVISSVATFKKPGMNSKGLYKLQNKWLSEFNSYFYHYNRSEQSKAEDQHKRRCKEEGIPAVFSPPVPVDFSPTFANIVDILRCKKMVELFTILLRRIKICNPKSWTDEIFHEVLHLIGLALHEETRQRKNQQSFGFLDATKSHKHSLIQCLEDLQGNPIVGGHSELLGWVIKKFNDEIALRGDPSYNIETNVPGEVVSGVKKDGEKAERQRLCKERNNRILMQMADLQKIFIRENSELFSATNTNDDDEAMPSQDITDGVAASPDAIIGIGNRRSPPVVVPGEQVTCILCQELRTTRSCDRDLVYSAYVQRSTMLSKAHGQAIEERDSADPLVSYKDHRVGVHMSSCGHVMHGDCWRRYFESLEANERLSLRLRIQRTIDLAKREFLCPLCGGLSNTVLPLFIPNVNTVNESARAEITWPSVFRKIEDKINQDHHEFVKTQPSSNPSIWSIYTEKFLDLFRSRQISPEMNAMMKVFSQATFTSGLNVEPDEDDSRVPLMTWTTCAYTIQCLEHSSRNETNSIVDSVPRREIDVLKSLVLLASSVGTVSKPADILNHCLRLISVLPGSDKRPNEQCSFTNIDLFDWMIKALFCLPSLVFHDEPNLDEFVFQLSLAGSITEILLTTPQHISTDEMDDCHSGEQHSAIQLANLWQKLRELSSQVSTPGPHPSPQKLFYHLQHRLLPFLRCCAIFFHILNSTPVPPALRNVFVSVDKEFEALSEFLALPKNLTDIFGWNDSVKEFQDDVVLKIVKRWCLNYDVEKCSDPVSFSLEPNNLVELPNDYSELISQASNFNCPVISGRENRIPAQCLVCGQMLCCEAYCCKETIRGQSVGPCTAHALRCGGGVGVFLRVRECVVILLNGIGKGCMYPAPYLDEYGETDYLLRRGNPLYLCHERYDLLKKIWKQHGIGREIVRHLESDKRLMHLDWASY